MRKTQFSNGGVYHVFNRGVEKRDIYLSNWDRKKFLSGFDFRGVGVEILAFCLMTNHYHLLLKQTGNEGISHFMHRLGTSYTMYFNRKYERKGRLFESVFKAVEVSEEAHYLHVSRYIHMNPIAAMDAIAPSSEVALRFLERYRWSSFSMYLQKCDSAYGVHIQDVMDCFESADDYREFVRQGIEMRDEFEA